MYLRTLAIVLLAFCPAAAAQDLLPDEASEFLATASAKIKANCEAIKSWQAKITAREGRQRSQAEFTLAENGNRLLTVESTTSRSTLLGAEPAQVRTSEDPFKLEYFSHGLTLDKTQWSPKGRRVINQTPVTRAPATVDLAQPDPLRLFQHHSERFDEVLLKLNKTNAGESFSYRVKKPAGADSIWEVTIKKSVPTIRTTVAEETWRLDESKAFLPISYRFKLGSDSQENTYEYEAVGGIYLPIKATVHDTASRGVEFQVETQSVNCGPKVVTPTYAEGDRLNNLSGKRLVFHEGAFQPAEEK